MTKYNLTAIPKEKRKTFSTRAIDTASRAGKSFLEAKARASRPRTMPRSQTLYTKGGKKVMVVGQGSNKSKRRKGSYVRNIIGF